MNEINASDKRSATIFFVSEFAENVDDKIDPEEKVEDIFGVASSKPKTGNR